MPGDRMGALAASGIVRPTTLVWHEGLKEWISAGEAKPEWFVDTGGTSPAEPGTDPGLVTDLAGTLRMYAGWVEFAGWLHAFSGVLFIMAGTVIGYFSWFRSGPRPSFLLWATPEKAGWIVGGTLAMGLLLLFMAAQLMGGAERTRRAETLQSREELRIALRSMGSFFKTTVLTLILCVAAAIGILLYEYRPWKAKTGTEPAPKPPVRERVTI